MAVARRRPPVAAFEELADKRVVLFGGKGGVGKTTISIAAALHFAKSRPAILFTTDPASNLADVFAAAGDRQPAALQIESLDADALYEKFLDTNLASFLELGDRGTYLDKEELRRLFELSVPGVDELMAWMRIGQLAEDQPHRMLIVDTAPTGHTLRMLGSADHFHQLAKALDAMQAKHRSLVRQFTRRNVRDWLDEFLEKFAGDAERRRALLAGQNAAFIPITLSEPWVVEQTKRLIDEIEVPVPFVILNRVCQMCDRAAARDGEARKAFGVPVRDAPRACSPLDTPERIEAWMSGGQAVLPSAPPGHVSKRTARIGSPPRLTFLAGKGGVGKTTCSASIALQLAKTRRVTVISVDPAHSLADVFRDQKPPDNLTVEMIDTRAKWRRFRDTIGDEIERAVGALTPKGVSVAYDTEAMQQLIEIAPPGADELFAIDRLSELIADASLETIVVDTAPTGHFLRLLDLPQAAGEWVREFMRILLRYRDVIPAGSLGEELIRASRSLHSLEKALKSEECGVIVVTRPERVVVAETERLIADVERRSIRVSATIANYVTPETECECDRSMRAFEAEVLASLKDVVMIERRDAPVISLADLATLVPLDSAQ